MHYQVSRDGQIYGPYTFEDLQRYLAAGNVLPTDLAKSETMTDWLPVSQIMAGSQAAPSPGGFAAPVYDPSQTILTPTASSSINNSIAASQYPDPPNLHWGLYLLFATLTCGLFSVVFTCIQAAWLNKVQPNSKGLAFYVVAYVIYVVRWVRRKIIAAAVLGMMGTDHTHLPLPVIMEGSGLFFLYWAILFTARFMMRDSIQEHFNTVEPIGLSLNPVLTFFFGGVYFQSQFNRINELKQAARLGAGRSF